MVIWGAKGILINPPHVQGDYRDFNLGGWFHTKTQMGNKLVPTCNVAGQMDTCPHKGGCKVFHPFFPLIFLPQNYFRFLLFLFFWSVPFVFH